MKQAETFAAVREEYGIERQESLKLRDFPTLQHVVQFVYDNRPDLEPKDAAAPPAPASVTAPPIAMPPPAPVAPAPPPAAPAAPAAAAPPAAASVDPVVQKVLDIVSEKTGYPSDMLEMDLDLEADLGVDTVKQAETFAAVREAYGIERQESLKLRDFPTLQHVVQFVYDFRPDLGARSAVAGQRSGCNAAPGAHPHLQPRRCLPPRQPSHHPSPSTRARRLPPRPPSPPPDPVVQKVLAIVADKTGYPPDMLEMDLDLEADLGVDTVKQAETFAAVREAYGIERQENLQLRDFPTLQHVVQFVYDYPPGSRARSADRGRRSGRNARPGCTRCLHRDSSPAQPPAPSVPAPAPPASRPLRLRSSNPVVQKVLEIVADKTGYPQTCWRWTSTSRPTSAWTP